MKIPFPGYEIAVIAEVATVVVVFLLIYFTAYILASREAPAPESALYAMMLLALCEVGYLSYVYLAHEIVVPNALPV